MSRLLARMLFFPTLAWNALCGLIVRRREWWNTVDDCVILGALPFRWHVPPLKALGVTSVINMCEEWSGPSSIYAQHGIVQLRLPTVDYHPPSVERIEQGVAFIRERHDSGDRVYIHCKAGCGRSATVVLCWLMSQGMTPEEAQRHLLQCRPHVSRRLDKRTVVQEFYELLSSRA